MSDEQKPRILPFVPLDRTAKNQRLDLDIEDQERAEALRVIAEIDKRLLDIDRRISHLIEDEEHI